MKQLEDIQSSLFRLEHDNRFGKEHECGPSPRPCVPCARLKTAVSSLVLGLRLRGFLTESEQSILELLGPNDGVTTFIHGDRFIEHEKSALLTEGSIDLGPSSGNGEIFTQRYKSPEEMHQVPLELHTVQLGMLSNRRLVLGVVSRSNGHTRLDDELAELVETFHSAWKTSNTVLSRLADHMGSNAPLLIVNQTSARVIYTSPAMCSILDRTLDHVLDHEYGEVYKHLAQHHPRRSVKITRLEVDSLRLAVVESKAMGDEPLPSRPNNLLNSFFVHKARNQLAAITAASTYLQEVAREEKHSDTEDVAGMIVREAFALEHHIQRFELFHQFQSLPFSTCSLESAVIEAAERIQDFHERRLELHTSLLNGISIQAPKMAPTYLLEAVAVSQLPPAEGSIFKVRAAIEDNCPILEFITRAELPDKRMAFRSNWQQFALHLADCMGVEITYSLDKNKSLLSTTLRFKNSHNRDTRE